MKRRRVAVDEHRAAVEVAVIEAAILAGVGPATAVVIAAAAIPIPEEQSS